MFSGLFVITALQFISNPGTNDVAGHQSKAVPPALDATDAGVASKGEISTESNIELELERIRVKARSIRELIAGRLNPLVDPAELFQIYLGDTTTPIDFGSLLRRIDGYKKERSRPRRAPGISSEEDPYSAALEELFEARVAFFRLPTARRQRLLSKHRERRLAAERSAKEEQRKMNRIAGLKQQIRQLQAFMAGELDHLVDPKSVLQIDLNDEMGLIVDRERRRRFLKGLEGKGLLEDLPPGSAGPQQADLDEEIKTLQLAHDRLRLKYLQLSDAERVDREKNVSDAYD